MNIVDFIKKYHNHPVFFIGTGFSLRYLEKSFSWDALLGKISSEIHQGNEAYLELKVEHKHKSYDKIASVIEQEFTDYLKLQRNHPQLKLINDKFFELASQRKDISRFKIYIAEILSDLTEKQSDKLTKEISALKKARKNISSIITTNYDQFIEKVFEFNPLIGNDILLSNPYGSVYKIHGCTSQPESIIITEKDYEYFNQRYELIRAQLLSLFIHNPIIFIGYSISDDNIKSLLKTIFTYVSPNSELATKISNNFLLIEYEKGSTSQDVFSHDIDINGSMIGIKKIKTDDYTTIYQAIADLRLPVSTMDIRKVQTIVADIESGEGIKVSIIENLDDLHNDDKVLVIGSKNKIRYEYQTLAEMMSNYFTILDEENIQLIELINKQTLQNNQFFPIFAFSKISNAINNVEQYKRNQQIKLTEHINKLKRNNTPTSSTISAIQQNEDIAKSYKENSIFLSVHLRHISLDECKTYLLAHNDKKNTNYKRLLCLYDYMTNSNEPLI